MKKKSSRMFKLMISMLLVISVLCCSFSVFAYDYSDEFKGKEAFIAYCIWQFLNSVGIEVTYRDILEYNDYIQDTIIDWVIDYIADMIEADSLPSNYTISQWIAPWQTGYDYWGNLQYNSSMLDDLQDFAEWLKAKFSLIDNSTIVINPIYSASGYTVYDIGAFYNCQYEDGSESDVYVAMGSFTSDYQSSNNIPIGYFIITEEWVTIGNSVRSYPVFVFSNNLGQYYVDTKYLEFDSDVSMGSYGNLINSYSSGDNCYYSAKYGILTYSPIHGVLVPEGNNAVLDSIQEVTNLFNNLHIYQEGNLKLVTANIVLPYENPDYSNGDGVTIVDGVPSYGDITFSGVIENLPAIVSTGTIDNPHMEEAYRPVQGLLEMTKDGVELMHGIVNELPGEAVTCIYALIGAVIIFGMIRLMREH